MALGVRVGINPFCSNKLTPKKWSQTTLNKVHGQGVEAGPTLRGALTLESQPLAKRKNQRAKSWIDQDHGSVQEELRSDIHLLPLPGLILSFQLSVVRPQKTGSLPDLQKQVGWRT